MADRTIIQTIGAIAKEESLKNLDDNILDNTLVLENDEPFPGYHGSDLPAENIPFYLFFVTVQKHSAEKIIRISHQIKKYFSTPFDASAGKICIDNATIYCIRIKDLPSFELIPELQRSFVGEGVPMARKKKIKTTGIIQLRKHFVLEEIEKGIFKDLEEPQMHYLQIPHQLKWKAFKVILRNVKNNVENSNFDAALGALYLNDVLDVVRIFSNNWTTENLQQLRNKFLSEIQRFEH